MKRIFTLIVVSFLLGNLNKSSAQFSVQFDEHYQHTFSNDFSNEGRKVVTDQVTGFIYTLSDVTSDLDPSGIVTGSTYSYVVLNQYDNTGNYINSEAINVGSHTISGFDQSSAFGLELDGAGNVFIGYMNSNATTDLDINIAKFNSSLVQVWTYKYNPVTSDVGIDMKVSSTGQAYAAVRSVATGGITRYRLIKATGSGISVTYLYSFSAYPDFVNSIALDANQNIYTTGYRLTGSVKKILTASFTSTGTLRWEKGENCGSVTGDDVGRHIVVSDDFVYITGSSTGTAQHGIDAVTMKYNATSGKKQWENFINFNLTDGGYFVSAYNVNQVFVFWSAGNTVYVDQIDNSTGLNRSRAIYAPIPQTSYSSLSGVTIADVKTSDNNNFYITGSINGTSSGQLFSATYLVKVNFLSRGASRIELTYPVIGSFATSHKSVAIAINNTNSMVYLLQNYSMTNATHDQEEVRLQGIFASGHFRNSSELDENNMSSRDFTLLPNPANDYTTIINQNDNEITSVEVSDLSGKQVELNGMESLINNTSELRLDLLGIKAGLYFVRVGYISGEYKISKLIKN